MHPRSPPPRGLARLPRHPPAAETPRARFVPREESLRNPSGSPGAGPGSRHRPERQRRAGAAEAGWPRAGSEGVRAGRRRREPAAARAGRGSPCRAGFLRCWVTARAAGAGWGERSPGPGPGPRPPLRSLRARRAAAGLLSPPARGGLPRG